MENPYGIVHIRLIYQGVRKVLDYAPPGGDKLKLRPPLNSSLFQTYNL
jgi:hypothetical protein